MRVVRALGFLAVLPIACSAYAGSIALEGAVLVAEAATTCKIFFKHQAIVSVYCPPKTRTDDMVKDFTAMAKSAGWALLEIEVFNDEAKSPKSIAHYNSLPENYRYQSHTIQIKDGVVIHKSCFRNGKKAPC